MTSCKSRDFDHVQIIAVMAVARIVFLFFFFFFNFPSFTLAIKRISLLGGISNPTVRIFLGKLSLKTVLERTF